MEKSHNVLFSLLLLLFCLLSSLLFSSIHFSSLHSISSRSPLFPSHIFFGAFIFFCFSCQLCLKACTRTKKVPHKLPEPAWGRSGTMEPGSEVMSRKAEPGESVHFAGSRFPIFVFLKQQKTFKKPVGLLPPPRPPPPPQQFPNIYGLFYWH